MTMTRRLPLTTYTGPEANAARVTAPAGTPRPRNGQPDPDDYGHPASDVRARP